MAGDRKVLIAMGRGTASLHELIFRGYANAPGTVNIKTRLLSIADKYHRMAFDEPDGTLQTVEGEGFSLETANRMLAVINTQEADFEPTWFVVKRYVLLHGVPGKLNDGFPAALKASTLWELHLSLSRYKMSLPDGALSWLTDAKIGDSVSFTKRLDVDLFEVTDITLERRD